MNFYTQAPEMYLGQGQDKGREMEIRRDMCQTIGERSVNALSTCVLMIKLSTRTH